MSLDVLQERFGRSRNAFAAFGDDGDGNVSQGEARRPQTQRPNPSIRQYFEHGEQLSTGDDWRALPEIPTGIELLRAVETDDDDSIDESDGAVPGVPFNESEGAWPSKDDYLKAHYAFLREESTFFLRRAIRAISQAPHANEPLVKEECPGIGLYDNARVTAMTISDSHGPVTRMSFSTNRAQRSIMWETSSRLKNGSLLAVSPATDMFQHEVFPGVIAARPLSLLNGSVPEVDIFFPYDILFDPAVEYVIVEESTSYFEAMRDTMMVLQRMTIESFPLSQYLVDPETNQAVHTLPCFQPDDPASRMNLSPAIHDAGDRFDYSRVEMLSAWPSQFEARGVTKLDLSQMQALQHMLTKEVALIQGPPGTGKTHVSVSALKVLLEQMQPGDPPIVVACQTNHALDQLLGHVAQFEPNFIRLGSRTADRGAIEARTLFKVKEATNNHYRSPAFRDATKGLKSVRKDIEALLKPFDPENSFFDHHLFLRHKVISQAQFNSLESLKGRYKSSAALSQEADAPPVGPMSSWLGYDIRAATHTTPVSQVFNVVEEDLELEDVSEDEAERPSRDEAREALQEQPILLSQKWTTTASPSAGGPSYIEKLLRALPDLSKLPTGIRPLMYHVLVLLCKDKIRECLSSKFTEFKRLMKLRNVGRTESDFEVVKHTKLVGLTTTGMSKHRSLIAATGAKIAMLEEAAESLEGSVLPMFIPSLEQIIQVGDHQQLRPRAQKRDHEDMKWTVSLFERLVTNGVEMKMLRKQRRMRWEVSRLLRPIYGSELEDFDRVDVRAAVPGMGDFNTWFCGHTFPEDKDGLLSTFNKKEAELIVMFAVYLVRCGTAPEAITILTFYNGQKRVFLRLIRLQPSLEGIKVHTVDSYQGEENDVILLALTRSKNIGFVGNANRVNVALSRAKLGLYMFGNENLLSRQGGKLWNGLFDILEDRGPSATRFSAGDEPEYRIGEYIPITCGCAIATHESNHSLCRRECKRSHEPHTTDIMNASELAGNNGGCNWICMATMSCGHPCFSLCHPNHIGHQDKCEQPCRKPLPCHHPCVAKCYVKPCRCAECHDDPRKDDNSPDPQTNLLDFPLLSKSAPVKRSITAKRCSFHDFSMANLPMPGMVAVNSLTVADLID